MKLKQLVGELQGVQTWRHPKSELEQYPTPPDIAAHMLLAADAEDGLEDALVADLGCGGGVLGIGAALLGAAHVLAVDLDPAALEVAAENVEEFEVPVSLLGCDVVQLAMRSGPEGAPSGVADAEGGADAGAAGGAFDIVLMNPPFGTRNESHGADVAFMQAGLRLCRPGGAVYSLHKTSTRPFIAKKAAEAGGEASVVAELRFEIPRMYKHHRQPSKDVAVDFWRVQRGGGGEEEEGEEEVPS